MTGEAHFVEHSMEKSEKRRRIQIAIYLVHLGLLSIGLIYFVVSREYMLMLAGGIFVYSTLMDLLSRTSTIRTPIDKLQIPSIDWGLRLLDWLMIGVLVGLTVVEGIALAVYEPSQWWALPVWVPFLATAALAPLIVFGWMFDRTTLKVLAAITRSGFKQLPADSELWKEMRRSQQETRKQSLVVIVLLSSIALQFLMLAIWSDSLAMLMLWGILVTSVLKDMPLTRKANSVPAPSSS